MMLSVVFIIVGFGSTRPDAKPSENEINFVRIFMLLIPCCCLCGIR